MDILFEILFEIYLELMMFIVPERKSSSKLYRAITFIVAFAVLSGVIALFIWGIALIADHNNKLGYIPISVAVIISVIQIIAGFVLHNR